MATPSVCSYKAPLNWKSCSFVATLRRSTTQQRVSPIEVKVSPIEVKASFEKVYWCLEPHLGSDDLKDWRPQPYDS